MTAPRDEIDRLGEELRAARRHITELEAQLQVLRAELADATGSASARIAVSVVRKVRRVVPPEFSSPADPAQGGVEDADTRRPRSVGTGRTDPP